MKIYHIILIVLLSNLITKISNAKLKCYPYTSIDYNQKAYSNQMAGFSAAACAGYVAATTELEHPKFRFAGQVLSLYESFCDGGSMGGEGCKAFHKIKKIAKFASVYEKNLCEKRKIFVGAKGNYLKQFMEGRKVRLLNVGKLNKSKLNKPMSKYEQNRRVNQCSKIMSHYTKMIIESLSKKK
jgi:hypothetical protein